MADGASLSPQDAVPDAQTAPAEPAAPAETVPAEPAFPAESAAPVRRRSAVRKPSKPDAVLAAAVEAARHGILEIASSAQIGGHVSVVPEAERLVTHRFEAKLPGYVGWHWFATLARVPRGKVATVSEVGLLPSEASVLAPEWVPWSARVRPEDLAVEEASPGEQLPGEAADDELFPEELAAGELPAEEPAVEDVAVEELPAEELPAEVLALDGSLSGAGVAETEVAETELAETEAGTDGAGTGPENF